MKNIFVLGLDSFNRRKLESIREADDYRFHGLLERDHIVGAKSFDFGKLLKQADDRLRSFEGSVDAIVNFWDFPASGIHSILCERHNVPGPDLESLTKCDHKYWSRLEQEKAIPDVIPSFHVFDPFQQDSLDDIPIKPPMWVKPILSFSSFLAFLVEDEEEFRLSAEELRQGAERYGRPFLDMMDHLHKPPRDEFRNPHLCIAEAPLSGQQCTVEGFCLNGEVEAHAIIDTHWFHDDSEPSRYQHPSSLPQEVQDRMVDISRRVLRSIGYDNAAFNIEFYYQHESDTLGLLEINSRISQSHSHIIEMVDGRTNHEVPLSVAEGRWPQMPHRKGRYPVAAKFFVRRFHKHDAIVKRVPSPEEIKRIEKDFPDTLVQLDVQEGMRLSEVLDQDVYSQRLAMIHTAAEDEKALIKKFRDIEERLKFDMQPLEASAMPAR